MEDGFFHEVDFAQMLNEPWVIVLGLLIIILMTWIYIVPMVALTKKFQKLKYDYLEKIRNQIDLRICLQYYEIIPKISNYYFLNSIS